MIDYDFRRIAPIVLAGAAAAVLAACNGGGYDLSGTLTGLPSGTSVTVQDTVSGSSTTVAANGSVTFETGLASDANYNLAVISPQSVGNCTVSNGSGTLSGVSITDVAIVCAPPLGTVTTLAGSAGVAGATDGNGTAATFNQPNAVAVDSAGNIYVADTANDVIRLVTASGVVTTLAGTPSAAGATNGPAGSATFNVPTGVAVASTGVVYVADTGNNLIRMISGGTVSTLAGSGVAGAADGAGTSASFNGPQAIAVDASGNVFVADTGNSVVRMITPTGVVSTLAGIAGNIGSVNGTGTTASFNSPVGITVDSADNIYVADAGNALIRKVTVAGVVTTLAGTVGATGSNNGTGTSGQFTNPAGLGIDAAGNVYVADTGNNLIRMISPAGVVTTVAGTLSGTASAGLINGTAATATFNAPHGVAVNSSGIVYAADTQDDLIRQIIP